MLSGPRPAQNLLETCSLDGLRLAFVHNSVMIVSVFLSKVHHASKSEFVRVHEAFEPR